MLRIKLLKNRSDIGAGTRGSDMGIDAMEVAAITLANDYFTKYPYVDIPSHNETVYSKVNAAFAKRIRYVVEQCERVSQSIFETLNDGYFPIILSGDHSSALGTISGIKNKYPNRTLGVVWVDAHADLHSPYTSPSGNVHGMPLAAALNEDNLESAQNEVTEHTKLQWERWKNIGTLGPKMRPDHVVTFGVRDTQVEEDELMKRKDIKTILCMRCGIEVWTRV